MIRYINIIKKSILKNEFDRMKALKNLMKTLLSVFTKRAQILYVLDGINPVEHAYREFIFFKHHKAIYFWTHGLVTNFSEVLKSYFGNKGKYRHENLFELNWSKINLLVLSKIPAADSSLLNELLILKQALNIKIVCFVDQTSAGEMALCKPNSHLVSHVPFIDIPLYYNSKKNHSMKLVLYYYVFRTMTKQYSN